MPVSLPWLCGNKHPSPPTSSLRPSLPSAVVFIHNFFFPSDCLDASSNVSGWFGDSKRTVCEPFKRAASQVNKTHRRFKAKWTLQMSKTERECLFAERLGRLLCLLGAGGAVFVPGGGGFADVFGGCRDFCFWPRAARRCSKTSTKGKANSSCWCLRRAPRVFSK